MFEKLGLIQYADHDPYTTKEGSSFPLKHTQSFTSGAIKAVKVDCLMINQNMFQELNKNTLSLNTH